MSASSDVPALLVTLVLLIGLAGMLRCSHDRDLNRYRDDCVGCCGEREQP